MAYSYTVPLDPLDTLDQRIGDQVAQLQGDQWHQADAQEGAVVAALEHLLNDGAVPLAVLDGNGVVQVRGVQGRMDGLGGAGTSLTVNVYRPVVATSQG